jgi:hypothetical protein
VDELDRLPLSRRAFVGSLVALLGAFGSLPALLEQAGLGEDAFAADSDLVTDTLNGLVAFVVPGPDPYSVAQGTGTEEAGGLDAGVTPALTLGLNSIQELQPTLAASVAALLNSVAQRVDPNAATGPFPSPFANLSFADKAAVFAVLEGDQAFAPLRSLAGVLPALVSFLAYSEVAVFDPTTRTLTGRPVGWALSNYEGVADGRDELKGYFENRRRADA